MWNENFNERISVIAIKAVWKYVTFNKKVVSIIGQFLTDIPNIAVV